MNDDKWGLILFFALISFFFAFKASNSTPVVASLPKAVIIERDTAGRMEGEIYRTR